MPATAFRRRFTSVDQFPFPPRRDVVLVLLLIVTAGAVFLPFDGGIGISLTTQTRPTNALSLTLAGFMAVPLLFRTRWPGQVLVLVTAAFAWSELAGYPTSAASIALPVAAYTLGRHARGRAQLVSAACSGVLLAPVLSAPGRVDNLLVAVAVWVLPFLIGRIVAARVTEDVLENTESMASESALPMPEDSPTAAFANITPREHEVLALVMTGQSNAEIAAALFLSRETVKTHVASLLRKTEVRDRTQLAVLALTSGIGSPRH